MIANSPWLWTTATFDQTKALLVLIPCAGSSAQAYKQYPRLLQDAFNIVIVQRPGRMERRGEELLYHVTDLLNPLAAAINDTAAGQPVILAGHSLGALIAYELAAAGLVDNIRGLAAIAMTAPHILGPVKTSVKNMDDDEFAAYMSDHYQGIPPQLLAEPAFLKMFLPPLRADMLMFENYTCQSPRKLSCPVLALAGQDDNLAPSASMTAWQELTTGNFSHEILAGDHFFSTKNPAAVLSRLVQFFI